MSEPVMLQPGRNGGQLPRALHQTRLAGTVVSGTDYEPVLVSGTIAVDGHEDDFSEETTAQLAPEAAVLIDLRP
jgi:hypothetical protein